MMKRKGGLGFFPGAHLDLNNINTATIEVYLMGLFDDDDDEERLFIFE